MAKKPPKPAVSDSDDPMVHPGYFQSLVDGAKKYRKEARAAQESTDKLAEASENLAKEWHDLVKDNGPLKQVNSLLQDQLSSLQQATSLSEQYRRRVDLLNQATKTYAATATSVSKLEAARADSAGRFADAVRDAKNLDAAGIANRYGVALESVTDAQDAVIEGFGKWVIAARDPRGTIASLTDDLLVYSRVTGIEVSDAVDRATDRHYKYGDSIEDSMHSMRRLVTTSDRFESKLTSLGVTSEGTSFMLRSQFVDTIQDGIEGTENWRTDIDLMTEVMTDIGIHAAKFGATQAETSELMRTMPGNLKNIPDFFKHKLGASFMSAYENGELLAGLPEDLQKRLKGVMDLNIAPFQKQKIIFDQMSGSAAGMGKIFDQLEALGSPRAFAMLQQMGFTGQQAADLTSFLSQGGGKESFLQRFTELKDEMEGNKDSVEEQYKAVKQTAEAIGNPSGAQNTVIGQLQRANNTLNSMSNSLIAMVAMQGISAGTSAMDFLGGRRGAARAAGKAGASRGAAAGASAAGRAANAAKAAQATKAMGVAGLGAAPKISRFGRAASAVGAVAGKIPGAGRVAGMAGRASGAVKGLGALASGSRVAGVARVAGGAASKLALPVAAALGLYQAGSGIKNVMGTEKTTFGKVQGSSRAIGDAALAFSTLGLSQTGVGQKAINKATDITAAGLSAADPLQVGRISGFLANRKVGRMVQKFLPSSVSRLETNYERTYFMVRTGQMSKATGLKKVRTALDAAKENGVKVGEYSWMIDELQSATVMTDEAEIKATAQQIWGRQMTDSEMSTMNKLRAENNLSAVGAVPILAPSSSVAGGAPSVGGRQAPTAGGLPSAGGGKKIKTKVDSVGNKVTFELPFEGLSSLLGALDNFDARRGNF